MATIRDLQRIVDSFLDEPESAGYELRLNLSELIVEGMHRRDWSQRQLAEAAGVKESYITRLIHADANCTFESAGNVLFALGIRAKLGEVTLPTTSIAGVTYLTNEAGHGTIKEIKGSGVPSRYKAISVVGTSSKIRTAS